tara:strand:+ start:110 stop:358 length:249 start_codon:yes stop_codon:yes gene_type:complete
MGIPYSQEKEIEISYTKKSKIMTGIVNVKCSASFSILATTSTWREKLIFLMMDALLTNMFDASEIELANHCQGNRPVSKNNV